MPSRVVPLKPARLGSILAEVGKSDRIALAMAAVVKSAIEESGQSQRDVAQGAGVSLDVLRSRLAGRTPFLLTELAAVAEVIEVPLVDLVSRAVST